MIHFDPHVYQRSVRVVGGLPEAVFSSTHRAQSAQRDGAKFCYCRAHCTHLSVIAGPIRPKRRLELINDLSPDVIALETPLDA